MSFVTEFVPQWKDWKKNYQVRQNLELFLQLNALILGWNFFKGLIVNIDLKKTTFDGVWNKLALFPETIANKKFKP